MHRKKSNLRLFKCLKLALAIGLFSLSSQALAQASNNFFFSLLDSIDESPLLDWVKFDEKSLKNPKAYHIANKANPSVLSGYGLTVPSESKLNEFISVLVRKKQSSALMYALAKENFVLSEKKLSVEKLPQVFKYLPLALSAMNPKAEWGNGVGLWHLYFPQAVKHGLKVSVDQDERFHPETAASAAISQLKKLHRENNGNSRETILAYVFGRNYDSFDTTIYPGYTPESFLQAFTCLAYIMETNAIPVFSSARITFPTITELKVQEQLHLNYNYSKYPFNVQYIRYLNPTFVSGKFSPGVSAWIPESEEEKFYGWLGSDERHKKEPDELEKISHRISSGETLSFIARKYGVHTGEIKEWNKLKSDLIREGQVLTIYKRKK